jgi:hypothetical protein
MASILNQITDALLVKAKAVQVGAVAVVKGGRTAEAAPIPQTPWVEIGDGRGFLEAIAAGNTEERATPSMYVIFYVPGPPATPNPENEKRLLRDIAWQFRNDIRADRTLGGLVEDVRVIEWDSDLTKRNAKGYWYWALRLEVEFED